MDNSASVDLLKEILRNASLGKYRHFCAASRKEALNSKLGAPVVVITILLGSVFFISISKEIPQAAKWVGALLSLAAAMLSGMQSFLHLGKDVDGHRRVANRYLQIAQNAEAILAQYQDDLLDLTTIAERTESLLSEYQRVNLDSEPYPTKNADFKSALVQERFRHEWRTNGTRQKDCEEEEIGTPNKAIDSDEK